MYFEKTSLRGLQPALEGLICWCLNSSYIYMGVLSLQVFVILVFKLMVEVFTVDTAPQVRVSISWQTSSSE